jgi:hypothetical protein
MATVSTKVVFPAVLVFDQFASQVVRLGGVFPEIEIERLDDATGLHHFKIARVLPNYGSAMIASAVAESELQIDLFWNILAYVRDTTIKPTGQVFCEVNGNLQEFNPKVGSSMTARGVAVAGAKWFDEKITLFHKAYNYDLIKRFNFSRTIEEPIGRFVSLYSLLSSQCGDTQPGTDKLIESVDSSVAKTLSPKTGKPETIFTRLRNELAHNRAGVSVVETHRSIGVHLPRFEWIVKVIVGRSIDVV